MNRRIETPELPAGSADLRSALEEVLSGYFGRSRHIVSLKRCRSEYRSSFDIEELEVTLEDGTLLQLMFKDLSCRALSESARQAKPAFLYDPLREIEAYRKVLAAMHLGTAICYGAVVDQQAGRYWLFVEKVAGEELYKVGDLETWQQAARWLATFHARLADAICVPPGPWLRYDDTFYRLWLERACAFMGRRPAEERQRFARLADNYGRVIEHLAALPSTFLHGEFYASNVLLQETAQGLRVCPIDWEMAARGPGLVDLAALTAGEWSDEQRSAMARAYHETLAEEGGRPPDWSTFRLSLEIMRLHLAVQWLGWSPSWAPPPDKPHDWFAEALELAEKLSL